MTSASLAAKHPPLRQYLDAVQRYQAAKRLMRRAEMRADKWSRRIGDERAYFVAGAGFHDRRCIAAAKTQSVALDSLVRYAATLDTVARYMICGAVLCATQLCRPDNQNSAATWCAR
jgi:hypothetical protein